MKENILIDFDAIAIALPSMPLKNSLWKIKDYILKLQDKLSRRNMQIRELKKKIEKVKEVLQSDNTQDDKNESLEVILDINI